MTEHNVRRVPEGIAMNHESTNEELRLLGPQFTWSAVLHLINNTLVPEESMINLIKYLLETGFHVSNVFAHIPKTNEGVYSEAENSAIKNSPLLLAIENN